jgi:hypothetical protein
MGALNDDRLGLVRALIETAPDSAVRDLELALRAETGGPLAAVRALVRTELSERAVRDVVVAPVSPLCAPRADGFKQALFPSSLLPRLWKAMQVLEPKAVAVVASMLTLATDDHLPPQCDEICTSAAAAIRAGRPETEAIVRLLEDFRPGAAAQFAGYLELAPLARGAIRRLPAWLRGMTGEHAAAVRLLFKDADAIAPDASPRLLEMLLGQVAEPWTLLRVISAITNRAGDRYLSSSELSEFCERVMADMERHVGVLRTMDYDVGPSAGVAAGKALGLAIAEIIEFEECLDLNKEGPWGQRVGKLKGALSNLTEGYLKKCAKIVADALPTQAVRVGGVNLRAEPRLDQAPDVRHLRRALTSLAFYDSSRKFVSQGGYGVVHAKVGEEVTHRLDSYVEDIIAMLNAGDAPEPAHAYAYLEAVAALMALLHDEKSAQIVRRRAAALQAAANLGPAAEKLQA